MKPLFVITSLLWMLLMVMMLTGCNTFHIRDDGTFDVEQNMSSICIDGKTYLVSRMGNLLLIDRNRRVIFCI